MFVYGFLKAQTTTADERKWANVHKLL